MVSLYFQPPWIWTFLSKQTMLCRYRRWMSGMFKIVLLFWIEVHVTRGTEPRGVIQSNHEARFWRPIKCRQCLDWQPVGPIALIGRLSLESLLPSRAVCPLSNRAKATFVRRRQEVLVSVKMREIVHLQAGQCGNQIGAKVRKWFKFEKQTLYECKSYF